MNSSEALQYYDIGNILTVTPIHLGFINETHKIETDRGNFALQKVSPIFKPEVMEDISAALNHLKKNGLKTMEIIAAKTDKLYVLDRENFWRVCIFIDGITFETAEDQNIAYEAGKLLGTYHRVLNTDFHYTFKHHRVTKHNIPLFYKKYKKVIEKNTNEEIAKMIPSINKMIEMDLPKNLRKSVGHGDTKLTNFIFASKQPYRAITMVDWDDVGNHSSLLYELGSAFRSWCARYDGKKTHFDLGLFESALRGYSEGSQKFLTHEELLLIPQSIQVQSLQVASRFVRDFFEDSYFRFDPKKFPSRQAHSLFRAHEFLDLYHDVEKKKNSILELIEKTNKKR